MTVLKSIPDALCVVVTTPQEISLADVRKAVNFLQYANANVLGVVENMSGLVCPHCHTEIDLFKKGGGEELARRYGSSSWEPFPWTRPRWWPPTGACPWSIWKATAGQVGLPGSGRCHCGGRGQQPGSPVQPQFLSFRVPSAGGAPFHAETARVRRKAGYFFFSPRAFVLEKQKIPMETPERNNAQPCQ